MFVILPLSILVLLFITLPTLIFYTLPKHLITKVKLRNKYKHLKQS